MCQRFDRTRELAHLCNRRARRTVRYARFVVAVRSRSPQRPNAQSVKACVLDLERLVVTPACTHTRCARARSCCNGHAPSKYYPRANNVCDDSLTRATGWLAAEYGRKNFMLPAGFRRTRARICLHYNACAYMGWLVYNNQQQQH